MNKTDPIPTLSTELAELAGGLDAAAPLALMLAAGTQQAVATALKDWRHTARACLLLIAAAVAGGVALAVYNVVVNLAR